MSARWLILQLRCSTSYSVQQINCRFFQLAQKRGISRFKQYKVYVFKKTCLMPFVTVTENNTLCFKLFLFKRSAFLNRQQSKHSLVPLAASKNGRPSSCTFGVTVISSILIFGVDEIITHPVPCIQIKRLRDVLLTVFSLNPGGGGGDSHMKQTGMLVVSLRGVNFGFWSRLGCSGQSANILCHQGLV